jgi:hypothetical protein
VKLHVVEQCVVVDRPGMGRPASELLAVLFPDRRTSARVTLEKGTSSIESTSMITGPTG